MTRAIYGLKSSGASWHATLAQLLRDMGFEDTKADPDIRRRAAVKEDGTKYYELAPVYVDNILIISEKPRPIMDEISRSFPIKKDSIGRPETYLGGQLCRHSLPGGQSAWAMMSDKYVKNEVTTKEQMLKDDGNGFHLKTNAKVPLPHTYRPELDDT